MKICGGLLIALMIFCAPFASAAQAASDVQLAQASPAQPVVPTQPVAPAQPTTPADQSAQPADPSQTADTEEPAGNVATLKGTATVTRNGMTGPLKLQDDIFKGDVLQTGKNSTLGVTFSDDTTLNLSANSRVVVDNFIYQEGGKDNAALLNVTRGTMAFVAAAVAKTGDMKIETPTATLGIRGTTGVVEVPEGATANTAGANNVGIKLYPDADGRVGRIEVKARDGAPLGMLTQGASGFTVRGAMVPGFGMRMSAMPMVMSAQMVARDRSFTQRVFAMQDIGRRVVMQQRNFRMQNPNRPPAFGRPGFNQRGGLNQPGQRGGLNPPGTRPGNQPGLNQPGQRGGLNQNQPGLNNRPGQPNQPGLRNQPGQPNRPGLNQPGQPGRPGLQNQPGQRGSLQPGTGQPGRPGLTNQGGLQRPPGAPNQFGQRPGLPNQPGVPRQAGVPGGVPAIVPGAASGPAGILNRLGVPGRVGIPQVPSQRMPSALPRAGQALPSTQKKLPQLQKLKPSPKDPR